MSDERNPLYGLIIGGEWESLDEKLSEVMDRAKMWTMERIGDHYRHALPLKVTPEIAREMDIYIYKITSENRVELPFQQWFDEYHAEVEQGAVDDEECEWKRYLELAENFKDRIAKEEKR